MSSLLKMLPSGVKILMAVIGFALIIAVIFTLYAAHATAVGAPTPPVVWVALAAGFILVGTAILQDAPKLEAVANDLAQGAPLTQLVADIKSMLDGLPAAITAPILAMLPAHTEATVSAVSQIVTDALAVANTVALPAAGAPAAGGITVNALVADLANAAGVLDPSAAPALAAATGAIAEAVPVIQPAASVPAAANGAV